MSTLNSRDKAVLEKALDMGSGYVLDFSDRTMQAFFDEEFSIAVYDKKYDYDFPSKSKANRVRGIWKYEDNATVGKVVLALIDYAETVRLTKGKVISEQENGLFQKAKEIGKRLSEETEDIPIPTTFSSVSVVNFTDETLEEIKNISAPAEVLDGMIEKMWKEEERIKEQKSVVQDLLKHHQLFIDVLEIFCENTAKPSFKLNATYQKLANHIQSVLSTLELEHFKVDFYRPFTDLYSAETEWWGMYGGHSQIKWDDVRPQLYKAHSDITRLVNMALQSEENENENILMEANALINSYRVQPETEVKNNDEVHQKSSTDYITEAINFFKEEYNKVRIDGLQYEYAIGDSVETLTNMFDVDSPHIQDALDENRAKRNAIEQLHQVGFIKAYEIEERTKDMYYGFDYAICLIDESKLTQKEKPVATDFGTEKIVENVIKYELTHLFANSIQEKDIVLNHRHEHNKPDNFYVTKEGDDFYYKGKFINISKEAEYYKVFSALFAKLPKGGEVTYKDLIVEVKSRLPRLKTKTDDEVKKVIQSNLTEKQNGFIRNAGLPETEDNGKALIYVSRGKGLIFNNRVG